MLTIAGLDIHGVTCVNAIALATEHVDEMRHFETRERTYGPTDERLEQRISYETDCKENSSR